MATGLFRDVWKGKLHAPFRSSSKIMLLSSHLQDEGPRARLNRSLARCDPCPTPWFPTVGSLVTLVLNISKFSDGQGPVNLGTTPLNPQGRNQTPEAPNTTAVNPEEGLQALLGVPVRTEASHWEDPTLTEKLWAPYKKQRFWVGLGKPEKPPSLVPGGETSSRSSSKSSCGGRPEGWAGWGCWGL